MKIHDVEINLPEFAPRFEIKIDGVVLDPTCGVIVQSPMESGLPHTVVIIKIPANVLIRGKAGVLRCDKCGCPPKGWKTERE